MLTAADVEHKTFSTALRGYDLDEVDDFLDEVVATLREMNQMVETAQSTGGPAAVPPPPPPPATEEAKPAEATREPTPAVDETAVGRALIAAQTAADKLLEDAQSEAARIVDDARGQADTWEAEKEAKRVEAQTEMASLTARVSAVRMQLSVLADEVSSKLDDMDEVIATEGDLGQDDSEDEAPAHGQHVGNARHGGPVTAEASGGNDGSPAASDDEGDGDETSHLDQILSGVATDLQMGEEVETPSSDGSVDGGDEDESPEETS